MSEESGKKQQTDDLELTEEKAGDVKGGVLPSEPGSGAPRRVAVKHSTHHTVKGPEGGMGHK